MSPYPSPFADPTTDAERAVADAVARGGTEVVVFWAPWCSNSLSQLDRAYPGVVEAHPGVGFTFVSMWDGGASGEAVLRERGVPSRARAFGQPGVDQDAPKEARQARFLGLPVTWIPTTWVFRGGQLAYAFNYGELSREQLDAAIAGAESGW
jgi:hypothetical protein